MKGESSRGLVQGEGGGVGHVGGEGGGQVNLSYRYRSSGKI